jgi:hypothetical protein
VANQALADWFVRRARATGSPERCAMARAALAGRTTTQAPSPELLNELGWATVTRSANYPGTPDDNLNDATARALYALGWSDTVRAASPLPEHLSAVYGGALVTEQPLPRTLQGRSPEEAVDALAPAFPSLEPDAILQALVAR